MNLVHSFHVHKDKKQGCYCMSEYFGHLIFGKIIRVTQNGRIVVQSESREHILPKKSDTLIFTETKYGFLKINTLTLRVAIPNFFLEAQKKCIEMGVFLENKFCVSREFYPENPIFITYQRAKEAHRKLTKNGASNLIIHNGLKIYYQKNI